jgi:hypothetical protein
MVVSETAFSYSDHPEEFEENDNLQQVTNQLYWHTTCIATTD